MPIATLKEVEEKLGISPDDMVSYHMEGDKGIIEIELKASERDIELSALQDISEEFLSEEERNYYLNLNDL